MHIMSSQEDEEVDEDTAWMFGTEFSAPPRKYEQTETAILVMRHLRKLARSQSFTRKTEVWRMKVDESTGEVKLRKRKVNRKVSYLKNQTHGYLAVNDGVRAARDIARLLGGPLPLRQCDVELVA